MRGSTRRRCARSTRSTPGTGVELLIPDFNAKPDQLAEVFSSRPEVLAHNLETVPRVFKRIRPAFTYERSLSVLTSAQADGFVTKSNLILGMGETFDEAVQALHDLHDAGCDLLTITQYLRPSPRHHPVDRWVKPGGVRGAVGRRRGDRIPGRHVRAAGEVVVPRRAPVGSGDDAQGSRDSLATESPCQAHGAPAKRPRRCSRR